MIVQIYQGSKKKMNSSWIMRILRQMMKGMSLGTEMKKEMKMQTSPSSVIRSLIRKRVEMTSYRDRMGLPKKMKTRPQLKGRGSNSRKLDQQRLIIIYCPANTVSMN